jgi:hypothetical protein
LKLKRSKSDSGYATIDPDLGGLDYRTIAEIMTKDGHEMNAVTARNVFLRAMKKIALEIVPDDNRDLTDDDLIRIIKHPHFQSAIQGILHDGITQKLGDK